MPLDTDETAGGQNAHGNKKQNGDEGGGNTVAIVGLGHQYPPYTNALEDVEGYLARFCDMETPA